MGTINKTIQASEGEATILEALKIMGDKLTVMHQEIIGQRLVLTKVFALAISAAMNSTTAALLAAKDEVQGSTGDDRALREKVIEGLAVSAKGLLRADLEKFDEMANEMVEAVLAKGREERANSEKT